MIDYPKIAELYYKGPGSCISEIHDRSRIGRKSYWELFVVPRLGDQHQAEHSNVDHVVNTSKPQNEEHWVRSEEARRRLKLSTCDLAHAREAGTLAFKKVGNAYLYRLPDKNSNEE